MPEIENEKTVKIKMHVYKNVSEIPLSIPELNITIPVGGFSSPIPEPTTSLKAFVTHGMLTEVAGEEFVSQGPTAVTSGNSTSEMEGKPAPALATPDKTVQPGARYIPVEQSDPATRIKNYEGKGAIKDAVSQTVVAIRGDGTNPNPYGEIPPDAMSSILATQGRNFATETSMGDHIEDQAQKIIAKSVGAYAQPATEYAPPANTPSEYLPWLKQTLLQKKIAVFKSADTKFLNSVRNYERDPNVISCIDTRLNELTGNK